MSESTLQRIQPAILHIPLLISTPIGMWFCSFSNQEEAFSSPLESRLACDLLWLTQWGKSDTVPALSLSLQKTCMLLLSLLEPCHHHENKPKPTCLEHERHDQVIAVPQLTAYQPPEAEPSNWPQCMNELSQDQTYYLTEPGPNCWARISWANSVVLSQLSFGCICYIAIPKWFKRETCLRNHFDKIQ